MCIENGRSKMATGKSIAKLGRRRKRGMKAVMFLSFRCADPPRLSCRSKPCSSNATWEGGQTDLCIAAVQPQPVSRVECSGSAHSNRYNGPAMTVVLDTLQHCASPEFLAQAEGKSTTTIHRSVKEVRCVSGAIGASISTCAWLAA